MTAQARKHLKREALIGGTSNAVFNGLIAWWLLKAGSALAWSGKNSFVIDIFATAFILPFIVALIVIPIHKRKLAKGTINSMHFGPGSYLQTQVDRLPAGTPANAFYFGLVGLCLAAALVVPMVMSALRYPKNLISSAN